MPALVQILNGEKPANTPAIRVDTPVGTIWRYSGGGYTVMQQMMIDVTGTPFPLSYKSGDFLALFAFDAENKVADLQFNPE